MPSRPALSAHPLRPMSTPLPSPSSHALSPASCPPPPLLASAHPPSCRHTLVLSTDGVGMNRTAVREHRIDLQALDRIIAPGDTSRTNAAALEAQRRPNPALQPVRSAVPAPGNLLERAARPLHRRVQVDTPEVLRAALPPADPAALAAVPRGGACSCTMGLAACAVRHFSACSSSSTRGLWVDRGIPMLPARVKMPILYLTPIIVYVVAWAVEVLTSVGRGERSAGWAPEKRYAFIFSTSRASPATLRLPPAIFLLNTVRASDHTNLAPHTADLLSLQHLVPRCGSDARRSRSSPEGGRRRWIGYWQSSQPIVLAARSLMVVPSRILVGRSFVGVGGTRGGGGVGGGKAGGLGRWRRFRCPPPMSTRYALPNPNSSFGHAALGSVTLRADNELARDSGGAPGDEQAVEAFFGAAKIGTKCVLDGFKAVIKTGLKTILKDSSAGESYYKKFLLCIKHCPNRREISVGKARRYKFHNEGLISTHKNLFAYILCVSVVDHRDVTPYEIVYLASEFAGKESEQYEAYLNNLIWVKNNLSTNDTRNKVIVAQAAIPPLMQQIEARGLIHRAAATNAKRLVNSTIFDPHNCTAFHRSLGSRSFVGFIPPGPCRGGIRPMKYNPWTLTISETLLRSVPVPF
ncbi:hypothetical protein B0H14DRAFT_3164075 [Mycena olivaceomarginata]|nr:hypothetical protein B0H14DRAFT_3164075 [Mycena olivaceomarginata]